MPGSHRNDGFVRSERAIVSAGTAMFRTGLLQIKGKKPIAIELELTAKSRRRLDMIVDHYLGSDFDEVWYFTGDEQIQRKLTSVTEGYRMVKIRPLEASP